MKRPSFFNKKLILGVLLFSIHSLSFGQTRGKNKPRKSPNANVSQTIGNTVVTITYGRPGVKDRKIFGQLVPYGEIWRTGANESTNITFSDDVTIADNELEAGTYSLYSLPDKNQWTIILNTKLSWGTQYDESKDVVRFKATPEQADFIENMLFYFTGITNQSASLVLRWDQIKIPFTINT